MTTANDVRIPRLPLNTVSKPEDVTPSACHLTARTSRTSIFLLKPLPDGFSSFFAGYPEAAAANEPSAGALEGSVRTGSCNLRQLPDGFNSFMALISSLNFFHTRRREHNALPPANNDLAKEEEVVSKKVLPCENNDREETSPVDAKEEWVNVSPADAEPTESKRNSFVRIFKSCVIS